MQLPRRKVLKTALAVPMLGRGQAGGEAWDAIVVGAGASGCNTAWHLRQKGLRVLVLESAPVPAAQASRAAAGFVAHWSRIHIETWGKTEWLMQDYGIQFYSRLAAQCNRDIGFRKCGIAWVFTKPEEWQKAQPLIKAALDLGTKIEVLERQRAKELLPVIAFAQVAGIAFDPASIRVRASDMVPCLADECAKAGVVFRYNTHVQGFLHNGARVSGVKTNRGDMRASAVVVTAGAWSRPLLAMLDAPCPATPTAEIRYTTGPLAEVGPDLPMLIFSDYGFYIREERGGLLIGGGDPSPPPQDRVIDPAHPPPHERLPKDEAFRVRQHVREIESVMPVLAHAEINEIAGGIPTFTKDILFIADRVPGRDGLFVLSGCQEAGITHGPALGRIMAELVTDGKTTWDTSGYSLSRFA